MFRTGEHVALNERGKALRTDEMKGRVGVVMGVKDNFTVEIKGVKYSAPTERIKVFWENAQTVWTERPEHLLSLGK